MSSQSWGDFGTEFFQGVLNTGKDKWFAEQALDNGLDVPAGNLYTALPQNFTQNPNPSTTPGGIPFVSSLVNANGSPNVPLLLLVAVGGLLVYKAVN